uniref:UPAR/Ly6 domain-containing protein n=1 Tax=Mus spicilegus TaxID=10103 RepID=A0A8C6GBH5_MUSSI
MDSTHATKSCLLILLVALLCAGRAQGLQCYECYGVPIETSCPAVTCRGSDGFCIAQNIELIEGKFPVTYIKMAEEGFGENVMSRYLLWTRVPLLQIELF